MLIVKLVIILSMMFFLFLALSSAFKKDRKILKSVSKALGLKAPEYGEEDGASFLDMEYHITRGDWKIRLEYSSENTYLYWEPPGKLFDIVVETKKHAILEKDKQVLSGDERFDSVFVVMGDDESKIKSFLDAKTRQALTDLHALSKKGLDFTLPGAYVRLRQLSWIMEEDEMEKLINIFQLICMRYLEVADSEAQFNWGTETCLSKTQSKKGRSEVSE